MKNKHVLSQEAKKELAIVQFESSFDTLTEREYIDEMLTAYTAMRTGLNLKLKMYVRKQARIYKELKKYIEA